jgi:hypothetical protein
MTQATTGEIRFVDGMDGDIHMRVVYMHRFMQFGIRQFGISGETNQELRDNNVLMQFGIIGETNQEPRDKNVVIVVGGVCLGSAALFRLALASIHLHPTELLEMLLW